MPAVAIPDDCGLLVNREGPRNPTRGENRKRQLLLMAQPAAFRGAGQLRLPAVHFLQQRPAIIQPGNVDPFGRSQTIQTEIGQVGVARELPGVVAPGNRRVVPARSGGLA